MAVMGAYPGSAIFKQNALYAVDLDVENERVVNLSAFLPSTHCLLKASIGKLKIRVDEYEQQVETFLYENVEAFQLTIVLEGSVSFRSKEGVISLQRGEVSPINPAQMLRMKAAKGSRVASIKIPIGTLEEDAVHLGYHLQQPGMAFRPRVFKLAQLGVLKHQILSLLDDEPSHAPEALQVQYRRYFSCLLLQRFENNCNQFYKVIPCGNPKIEKIRQWVISDPRKEYKPLEIAAYINTSERSLYHLFKKEFGLSPRVYICQIKLEFIYRELKDFTNTKNITQVALEYGFNNLGRFSKVYRDYFGEPPSHTCRR